MSLSAKEITLTPREMAEVISDVVPYLSGCIGFLENVPDLHEYKDPYLGHINSHPLNYELYNTTITKIQKRDMYTHEPSGETEYIIDSPKKLPPRWVDSNKLEAVYTGDYPDKYFIQEIIIFKDEEDAKQWIKNQINEVMENNELNSKTNQFLDIRYTILDDGCIDGYSTTIISNKSNVGIKLIVDIEHYKRIEIATELMKATIKKILKS